MKQDGYYNAACMKCGHTGLPLRFDLCSPCSAEQREIVQQHRRERRTIRRRHANIIGLLMGNPAANAAERLRHLHIESLLAA